MEDRLSFNIPNELTVLKRLFLIVPSDWSWVDGKLYAPKDLIEQGKALSNTGIALSRYNGPRIISLSDPLRQQSIEMDLFGFIVTRKLPGFVNFTEVGYRSHYLSFNDAEKIAFGLICKGYRGGIFIRKVLDIGPEYTFPFTFYLHLTPWYDPSEGKEINDRGPSRISLGWDTKSGGQRKDIEYIIAACRNLGLKESV